METDNNKIQNKTVETYAEDMASVIEEAGGGLVKKIIQEQEAAEIEKKNESPESKKNKVFLLLGSILLLVSIGLLFFLIIFKEKVATVFMQPQFTPIIFLDQTHFEEIEGLAKEKIAESVVLRMNADIKAGEIEGIYLTEQKKIVGLRRFLELIKSSFLPGGPELVSDNFLIGVAKSGKGAQLTSASGHDIFILFKMRSFTDIFEEMRLWEDKMFSELHGFFGEEINSSSGYLLTKIFEDGLVENKNARILYDDSGNAVLMYVFADEQSVVITNSQNTAREVMLRLVASKVEK